MVGAKTVSYNMENIQKKIAYKHLLATAAHLLNKNFACITNLIKSQKFVEKIRPLLNIMMLNQHLPVLQRIAKSSESMLDWLINYLLENDLFP